MAVRFDDTEFRFAAGMRPFGFGNWAFFFDNGDVFWFNGTYGLAKREALKVARKRGVETVRLGA
jgi:hypothetical protein